MARGARTRLGREALSRLSPWDGLRGLRRLRQMELGPLWASDPAALPVVPFDEALDEVLNPAGLAPARALAAAAGGPAGLRPAAAHGGRAGLARGAAGARRAPSWASTGCR